MQWKGASERGRGKQRVGKTCRVSTMGWRLAHFALPLLLLLLVSSALDTAIARQHRAAKGGHHKRVGHHKKVKAHHGKKIRRQQSASSCFVGVNYGLGLSTHPIPVPQAISTIRSMGASGVKLWAPDKSAYAALAGTTPQPHFSTDLSGAQSSCPEL